MTIEYDKTQSLAPAGSTGSPTGWKLASSTRLKSGVQARYGGYSEILYVDVI